MKLLFKKFHPDAQIPKNGSKLAGGFDVTCTEIEHKSNGYVICKLGFGVKIPEGYMLRFAPRSSFTKYGWVMNNSPGLVDADYTGEIQCRFQGIPSYTEGQTISSFPYKVGDRIAQCWLEKVLPIEWVEVEELPDTERGSGGFGSTGNKTLK